MNLGLSVLYTVYESGHASNILRVSDQNGVSLLYIMLEIHHSGWEPSKFCKLKHDKEREQEI